MSQFSRIAAHGARLPVVRTGGPTQTLVVVTTGSARITTAFAAATEIVRIVATKDIWYKLGDSSVTAARTDVFLPAGVVEIIAVARGVDTHIAAIQDATEGLAAFLSVVEVG